MLDLKAELDLKYPLIQAGMGGGIAGANLASTVSLAGGLGTVGHSKPNQFNQEILATKEKVKNKPYSAGLLVPFATDEHLDICTRNRVPVVTLFFGFKPGWINKLKSVGCLVAYQVGSVEEADFVVKEGTDILIVQGVEAGGHVRGNDRLNELIPKIRQRHQDIPIFAAGGIYNQLSAANALAQGANGVLVGTRFLMSKEANAHQEYKDRLCTENQTILTTLFGLGWHAPHRVLQNEATKKWVNAKGDGPLFTRLINSLVERLNKHIHLPAELEMKRYYAQKASLPLYTPLSPLNSMTNPPLDYSALYAGECVKEIHKIESAADIVFEIGEGLLVPSS